MAPGWSSGNLNVICDTEWLPGWHSNRICYSVLSEKEQTKGKTSTFTDNQQITNPTGLIEQSASREKNESWKTQCQLCKRLAGPIISLSWFCSFLKRVSLWMWSLGSSQQPFSCVLGHFWHWHGDNKQTNNVPGDPSASRLLNRGKPVFCNVSQYLHHFWCQSGQITTLMFVATTK